MAHAEAPGGLNAGGAPLRIAVLCAGSYVGGMEVVTCTLAQGLRRRGHEVRVLANGFTDGEFPRRLEAAGIPHDSVYIGKLSVTLRQPYLRWSIAALARLPAAMLKARHWLDDFSPQVVIATNRDWVLLLGAFLRQRRVLFHMHEAPPTTPRIGRLFRRVAQRTTVFVAVSDYVRQRLLDLGISPAQAVVVHNGVSSIPAAAPRLASSPFTVGIVGRIGEWKGHDDLLAALGVLRARGVAFRCIVAGDGDASYVTRLRAASASLGIADVLDWRGFVDDPSALYHELDVCVVPSRVDEAFGMVAAEAALAGTPVIAARRGGLTEIARDGETGLLFDSGDVTQLAEHLITLALDTPKRRRMGEAARRFALERFTAERMVSDIEAQCVRLARSA